MGRASADPAAPPATLTQPDLTVDRALTAQTDLTFFTTDHGGWIVTERLALDWSFARTLVVSAVFPVAYTSFELGYDPTLERAGFVVGNPTLLARGRMKFQAGDWEVTPSIAFGVIVPTRRGLADGSLTEYDTLRLTVMLAHLARRPYDFSYDDPVVPVATSVRLTRGATTVQATGIVNTVIDDGDPQVDMLQAIAGVAWAERGIVLLADVGLLAIPPEGLVPSSSGDARFLPWVEGGLGWAWSAVDMRARLHVSADLPADLGGMSSIAGFGLDAVHRF